MDALKNRVGHLMFITQHYNSDREIYANLLGTFLRKNWWEITVTESFARKRV